MKDNPRLPPPNYRPNKTKHITTMPSLQKQPFFAVKCPQCGFFHCFIACDNGDPFLISPGSCKKDLTNSVYTCNRIIDIKSTWFRADDNTYCNTAFAIEGEDND